MKPEDAAKVRCAINTTSGNNCSGIGCMAWMSNPDGTDGQCMWMVLSNMIIKVLAGFMPRMVR